MSHLGQWKPGDNFWFDSAAPRFYWTLPQDTFAERVAGWEITINLEHYYTIDAVFKDAMYTLIQFRNRGTSVWTIARRGSRSFCCHVDLGNACA